MLYCSPAAAAPTSPRARFAGAGAGVRGGRDTREKEARIKSSRESSGEGRLTETSRTSGKKDRSCLNGKGEKGGTMRGSEGPTSAASFHSRLPCNLNRGDIIRPSILSSTWPLGVRPTRDISCTAYYLDRLHLCIAMLF